MIVIKRQLDTEIRNASIDEQSILQGNYSNLQFVFTLADNGEPVTVANATDLAVFVRCEKNKTNYTIPSTDYSVANNAITINANEAMANFDDKGFTINDLAIKSDTLITGGTLYLLSADVLFDNNPIVQQDCDIEIGFINTDTMQYLTNINGKEIKHSYHYYSGDKVKNDMIYASTRITATTNIAVAINGVLNDYIDISAKSIFCVQALAQRSKNYNLQNLGIDKLLNRYILELRGW